MTLTVEDGSGLATADSYVDVSEVTTYLAAHYTTAERAAWTAATSGDQEIATRRAFQFMVAEYRARWTGVRAHETQAGDWPRIGGPEWTTLPSPSSFATDDGIWFTDDEVPQTIKDAQCELALRAIDGPLIDDVETKDAGIASESKSAGGVSKSISYVSGGKSTQTEYSIVERLLRPFLTSGARVVRG